MNEVRINVKNAKSTVGLEDIEDIIAAIRRCVNHKQTIESTVNWDGNNFNYDGDTTIDYSIHYDTGDCYISMRCDRIDSIRPLQVEFTANEAKKRPQDIVQRMAETLIENNI